jgi:hypothetical protein
MPGFKDKLTETQIWQVSVLVKNADKISANVKAGLLSNEPPASSTLPVNPATVAPTQQH